MSTGLRDGGEESLDSIRQGYPLCFAGKSRKTRWVSRLNQRISFLEAYIPGDADGNPIPLAKQRVNGQDIPLPDPQAIGSHTVLGGKASSETGEVYRLSVPFR